MDEMNNVIITDEEETPIEVTDICTVDTEDTNPGIDLKDAAIGAIAVTAVIGGAKLAQKYVIPKVKTGVSKFKAWKHNRELVDAKKDKDAIETVEADFAEVCDE